MPPTIDAESVIFGRVKTLHLQGRLTATSHLVEPQLQQSLLIHDAHNYVSNCPCLTYLSKRSVARCKARNHPKKKRKKKMHNVFFIQEVTGTDNG